MIIGNLEILYADLIIVSIASFFDVVLTFYTLFLDEKRPKSQYKELNPLGRLIMRLTKNNRPLGLLIMGLFAQAVLWGAGFTGAGSTGAGRIYPFFQGVYFIIIWMHLHNISSLTKAIKKDKL